MNKYQEALDKLVHYLVPFHCTSTKENAQMINDCLNNLKELVDKETPRNVSALGKVDGIMQGACPNCGKPNPYSNFTVRCSCCGQRINFVRSEE